MSAPFIVSEELQALVRQGSAHHPNITRLIQNITRLLLGIACLWVCKDINVNAELHHRQLKLSDSQSCCQILSQS